MNGRIRFYRYVEGQEFAPNYVSLVSPYRGLLEQALMDSSLRGCRSDRLV